MRELVPGCEDARAGRQQRAHRVAVGRARPRTYCHCGPYTRESGYYPSRELAEAALQTGAYGR